MAIATDLVRTGINPDEVGRQNAPAVRKTHDRSFPGWAIKPSESSTALGRLTGAHSQEPPFMVAMRPAAHCGLMICAVQQAKQHQPVIAGIDGLGGEQPIAHYRADSFKQFQIDESHDLGQEKGIAKYLRSRRSHTCREAGTKNDESSHMQRGRRPCRLYCME